MPLTPLHGVLPLIGLPNRSNLAVLMAESCKVFRSLPWTHSGGSALCRHLAAGGHLSPCVHLGANLYIFVFRSWLVDPDGHFVVR